MLAVAVAYVAIALPNGGGSPTAIAIGALLVWWAVIVGLAVGGWPRSDIPGLGIATGASLAGLALLTLLSMIWADDAGRAFTEVVRVAGYLGLFVLVVVSSPPGGGRPWLAGLAIGLVAVSLLALGSRFEPFLPGYREVSSLLPADKGRLSYPIGYWNGLAACMAAAIPLLTWFGARAASRMARTLAVAALPVTGLTLFLSSSRGGLGATVVALIVLVVAGSGRGPLLGRLALGGLGGGALAVLASTKDALVDNPAGHAAVAQGDQMLVATLLVVLAVGAVAHATDERLQALAVPRISPRAGVAAIAVILVVGFVVADVPRRFDEFNDAPRIGSTSAESPTARLASSTGSGRYQFWEAALDAFESKPVNGIGAGGFETWWNGNGTLPATVRHAHSLYMETLAELGLLGLALVLGFLAVPVVAGVRRIRARGAPPEVSVALAMLAAGIVAAALEWTWYLPATFVPALVAAGLLTGPAALVAGPKPLAEAGNGANAGTPSRSRAHFGLGVSTLLVAWAAVLAALALLLTETRLSDSREAVRDGDLPAAAQAARDAQTIQPWASEPRLQLALVEEAAGDLPAARQSVEQAIDRAYNDYRVWLVAARIEADQGDTRQAVFSFHRAALLTRQPRLILDQRDSIFGKGPVQ